MEFLLDTANLAALREGIDTFPVSGVTTNPSILKAELPMDAKAHLTAIRGLCGPSRTLHVQVGALTCDGMIREAEALRAMLGDDLYIKVPVSMEGIKAIRALKKQGVNVTATAIHYEMQALLAVDAGADYLAPYCNRMDANDIPFAEVIAAVRDIIDRDDYSAKILAASFKNIRQVNAAIEAGAHAVTVPPELLKGVLNSPLITTTVDTFAKANSEVFPQL